MLDKIKEYCQNKIDISSKYMDIENHTITKCYKDMLEFIDTEEKRERQAEYSEEEIRYNKLKLMKNILI